MKWIYLPALFALAFFYTKTSLTDFLPKKVATVIPVMRKPASFVEIKKLPTKRIMPEDFYNSLNVDGVRPFDSVAQFKGVIVSDTHVDNFGFVIGDNKKSIYTIMDSSEVSQGKLYLDVLAHLVSSKTVDKNISWMQYFEAYKRGLKKEPHTNSFYVIQGNDSAILNSEMLIQQSISDDNAIKFKNLKKGYHEVLDTEKKLLETEVRKQFPKAEFFDIRESDVNEGSYHVLARLKPINKVQWLMIREKKETAHDEIYGHEDVFTIKAHQELLKKNIYAGHVDKSLMLLTIGGKPFSLRFAEQFSTKLSLKDIPAEDHHDILMDQAYALGLIHLRSLGSNVDNYIKGWAKIPAAVVDEKAVELKHKLRDE